MAFLILILCVPFSAKQALRLRTGGSGSRKERAAGRNEEGVEMNAKAGRGGTGKGGGGGGSLPRVCLTRKPDRFSRLPPAAPLPASPRAVCRRQPAIFPLPALASLGFSPTVSAPVRAQWERVAKAKWKRPVPAPDVLAAVYEMSLCALSAAQRGCLASVCGAGYRKL